MQIPFTNVNADNNYRTVIPLQFLGVSDTEQDTISLDEHMKYALANMDDKKEGYIVRHRARLISEFGTSLQNHDSPLRNPLAAAYPVLFPYGIGGIETKQD